MKVLHAVNEEWLFGEIGSRTGQFPVQFIDHVPPGVTVLETNQDERNKSSLVHNKPRDMLTETLAMWDDHNNKVG